MSHPSRAEGLINIYTHTGTSINITSIIISKLFFLEVINLQKYNEMKNLEYIFIYIDQHMHRFQKKGCIKNTDIAGFQGRVLPKTQKMVPDIALLITQHYMVWIKGKCNNRGKGVVHSLTPRCCSYWIRNFWLARDYCRPTYNKLSHTQTNTCIGTNIQGVFKKMLTFLRHFLYDIMIWKSDLTDKIKQFFLSSGRVESALWMNYMDAN